MYLYFVRHGETSLNRRHRHQSPSTPLSPRGREQALTAAEYLRVMSPTLLLSSGHTRAVETARIIGSVLDLSVMPNNLFREVDRPTSLAGKHILTPATLHYVLLSVLKRNDPGWRYEDAENFNDIYMRSRNALAYLETLSRKHQSVAVVSHSIFINLLVAYMCHDRMMAVRDLLPSFFNMGVTDNCGIVELRYTGPSNQYSCAWELVVRNGTSYA